MLQLRGADLDTTGAVWAYRPASHKLEHQGRERIVFLGPEAQAELTPWIRAAPEEFLFGPKQLREYDLRHRQPPRPRTESERRVRGRRRLRDHYTRNGYIQAIRRASDRAKVGRWAPNQLRHNAATMQRARYGVEAAKVILGHTNIRTTQIYAEADLRRAATIMGEVG